MNFFIQFLLEICLTSSSGRAVETVQRQQAHKRNLPGAGYIYIDRSLKL
ncbi:hypothetical protein [Trichocoleus sp. Lan]